MLPPAVFEKFKSFFPKNPLFYQNSWNCLMFLRNLTNRVAFYRVAFYTKLATISEFWKTKTFFRITLFWKKPNFWTFWEIPLFHSHSASNWLSSACFRKLKFRFQKNHLFFWLTQILIFFEISYRISCILQQICYYQLFLKISIFFSENLYIYWKNPNFDSFEKPYCFIRIRHQVG